jgi:hypothetical protein
MTPADEAGESLFLGLGLAVQSWKRKVPARSLSWSLMLSFFGEILGDLAANNATYIKAQLIGAAMVLRQLMRAPKCALH